MEKQTEVKSFEVHQYCDKCGTELTFTGEVLLSNPAKYVHKCNKCGNTEWYSKSYPCVEYKEVQKDPITIVDLSDDFKNTLERVKAKRNKEHVKESKSEEINFTLNPNEVDEYDKFIEEHKKCKCSATIGGKISIIFTPTGLGDAKSVKCNVCGEEREITDVSNW
jgi:hypothetical protein